MKRKTRKITRLSVLAMAFVFLTISCQKQEAAKADAIPPVPEWAKTAVWYQIFPERFANGDPGNDPAPEDMAGGWPYFIPENWQPHPWTSDWYELQSWEKGIPWHEHFSWAKEGEQNFSATAGLRRYGGDLQGVIDRLDYLADLGVTALYFNPLFEAPSLHKYDATYYHHIDNNFGPDPEGDRKIWAEEDPGDPATWKFTSADSLFLELIKACHARGMKVIIDGVFNHTGSLFWAFQDIVKNQQNSPYKDWFIIKSWDDPGTPENEFDYEGWAGVRDLPEIREDENGLVQGPREHVKTIVKRWMDPNGDGDPSDGIDGWRLDVAEKVEIGFWKDFQKWVKEINPQAYTTGEVWWEDWGKYRIYNAAPWFDGAFDAVMNYRFARAVKFLVMDHRDAIDAAGFADSLRTVYKDYRWDNVLVCMNLMDSHDVDRVTSQIVNPDRWFDHGANPMQNPDYSPRKPTPAEYAKQRLIAALQMTLPGAPMIYYGDETGMWGGDDPDCRKPMVWPELSYTTEVYNPDGSKRSPDPVSFDRELFDWYRKVIALRKGHPVLATGKIDFRDLPEMPDVLAFRRSNDRETLYVVVNDHDAAREITFEPGDWRPAEGSFRDLLNGSAPQANPDGQISLILPPYGMAVLR
ncbi:MAG TPA: glycoside hydrolase family 13 protein [Calditrichia bacterium]|nr:glycoside hydrolase family 13 protein [Calditrichia bacterium]